jgi:mannose/fructose/N-acetylgalactosamine-specific phosphotransferase system component IIC
LLAGWVGADTTAALQIMVSQPLVAGWLGGVVMGEPTLGLGVGLTLQLVWGRAYALGGASFPVVGPAAVAAAGVAALSAPRASTWGALRIPDAASLAASLAAAFVAAEVGRALVMWKRRHRAVLVERAVAAAEAGSTRGVVLANWIGVLQSVVLGIVLGTIGLSAGTLGLRLAERAPVADGMWVALPVFGAGLGHTMTLVERRGRGLLWLAVTVVGAAAAWGLR